MDEHIREPDNVVFENLLNQYERVENVENLNDDQCDDIEMAVLNRKIILQPIIEITKRISHIDYNARTMINAINYCLEMTISENTVVSVDSHTKNIIDQFAFEYYELPKNNGKKTRITHEQYIGLKEWFEH